METTKNSFFTDLWATFLGKEYDFTKGSINRAIALLALPMMAEMMMESLFSVVDIFFVSKLGVNAIATVGLTEAILMIVFSIGIGLSMAATAVVSRRIGEKDVFNARVAAVQGIFLAIVFSVFIAFIGFFFSAHILQFMGAEEAVVNEGSIYTKIILVSNVVIMLLFVINAIFRGAGNAGLAMVVLVLSNGLNILLDPLLIFGYGPIPAMGLKGAAIATTIGRGIGVLIQFYFLFAGTSVIKIARKHIRLNMDIIMRLLRISIGGIGQYLIGSASWLILMRIMAEFGSVTVAGFTLAFRIIIFTFLPCWGLAAAAATLVGQNLGAKQIQRAETSVWRTAKLNTAMLCSVAILYLIFADDIVFIFTQDAAIAAEAVLGLTILSFSYVFFGYGLVLSQAFNGAGDTLTPTIMNLIAYWCCEFPLAYLLAIQLNLGSKGVYFAVIVALSVFTLVGLILFKRGRWKTIKV